jgi:hypothetical protein
MAISIHNVSPTRDEQQFMRVLVLWKALRLPYRTTFRVFSGEAYVSSDQMLMLTSNTLTMPCRTPCKSDGIRGWSRPAGLATRDDITRLLGLEHVYALEHTYGVAADQSVDGQGRHERRTLASPQYGS